MLNFFQYSAFPAEAWRSDTHDLHVRWCTINIIIVIVNMMMTRCQASNVYGRVVSTLVHVRGVVEEALVIRSKPHLHHHCADHHENTIKLSLDTASHSI